MKKTLLIIVIVLVVIFAGILIFRKKDDAVVVAPNADTSSQTTSSTTGTAKPAQKAVQIGQSTVIDGVTIKLTNLKGDSRCPEGVACLQAGSFAVMATVSEGKVSVQHEFITGTAPFSFQGYDFSIASVTPAPISGGVAIKPTDYRITFQAVPTPKNK